MAWVPTTRPSISGHRSVAGSPPIGGMWPDPPHQLTPRRFYFRAAARSAAGTPASSSDAADRSRGQPLVAGGQPQAELVVRRAMSRARPAVTTASPIPAAAAPSRATRPSARRRANGRSIADLLERPPFLEAKHDNPPVIFRQPFQRTSQRRRLLVLDRDTARREIRCRQRLARPAEDPPA